MFSCAWPGTSTKLDNSNSFYWYTRKNCIIGFALLSNCKSLNTLYIYIVSMTTKKVVAKGKWCKHLNAVQLCNFWLPHVSKEAIKVLDEKMLRTCIWPYVKVIPTVHPVVNEKTSSPAVQNEQSSNKIISWNFTWKDLYSCKRFESQNYSFFIVQVFIVSTISQSSEVQDCSA